MHLCITVEPLHNGHLGDRRKWPLWRGGRYGEVGCNMTPFFREVQHVYCAKFMLTVAYNDNPILNNIYR